MLKCNWCDNEAIEECQECGKLFCSNHGDVYYPEEETICNDCIWEIEKREQEEAEIEDFLEDTGGSE